MDTPTIYRTYDRQDVYSPSKSSHCVIWGETKSGLMLSGMGDINDDEGPLTDMSPALLPWSRNT